MKKSRTMTYDKDSHIKSVEDVKAFFHHLVDERKVNFYPDDDFADHINYDDKTPTFTIEKVTVYNQLKEESFNVCDAVGVDIYEIGSQELQEALGV